MKTMKLTIAAVAIIFSSAICQAQENADQNKKQDKSEKVAAKLNLNPEQTKSLKVLKEELKSRNQEIKTKIDPLQEQIKTLRAERKSSHEVFMKEIETILTPEQFVQFKELKEARKEKRKKGLKEN